MLSVEGASPCPETSAQLILHAFDQTGPKKDIPSEPTPLPPGIMQETPPMVEAHPGMRRSFNAALATGAPANMPIYRSFDQGNLASFTRLLVFRMRRQAPVCVCVCVCVCVSLSPPPFSRVVAKSPFMLILD